MQFLENILKCVSQFEVQGIAFDTTIYLHKNVFQHQIIDNCRKTAISQNLAINHSSWKNIPAHIEECFAQDHFTFR